MSENNEKELDGIAKLLFNKFDSLMLNADQTASVVGRSKVSLSRDRGSGIGIPYTSLGAGKGSDRALYNVYDIGRFIISRKVKVIEG